MPEDAEKPGQTDRRQDDTTAPDSETQSSADSAQGERNNPEINEEKTGSRVNEPAEGGR
ncbi:hypothetical protein [Fibrivirga algicola]|uniref:hypothetical protein n=1 Tax=Fibrivirga algicola TaxID=2950420 RepID=UPI0012F8B139|nr:hypothetical protein [Fibrivirga algicola]